MSCLLTIVVGVVLLLVVEWRLALVLCALLPMVIVGPRWLGARASRASYERQRDAAAVMSATEESLAAHAVIKAFDLQGIDARRLRPPARDALSEHGARQPAERPAGDVDQRQRLHPADRGHRGRRGARRARRTVRRAAWSR